MKKQKQIYEPGNIQNSTIRFLPNMDYTSLYPKTMRVYDIETDKSKAMRERKKKLESIGIFSHDTNMSTIMNIRNKMLEDRYRYKNKTLEDNND